MFFSVKKGIKIGDKLYQPCICYPVTKLLELTVNKLAEEGKVVIYSERVFFQNGKVIESKPVTEEKKITKKKVTKKTTIEKEAEDAGLPTELPADESEGF